LKFYTRWQRVAGEDARTALVFGFMRHAPAACALNPWLTEVLGRPVEAEPLEPASFWPSYASTTASWTEPDLGFPANDGRPLWVIVEAKAGYAQHTSEQIKREVVDTARDERARAQGASRIAVIMVGANLRNPYDDLEMWRADIAAELAAEQVSDVEANISYSSWDQLGEHIRSCGRSKPEWAAYAQDVVGQLNAEGLLGYKGAPVFDGLRASRLATSRKPSTASSSPPARCW
jgi:hypothetical protein